MKNNAMMYECNKFLETEKDYLVVHQKHILSETFSMLKYILALSVVADHFLRTSDIQIANEIYFLSGNEYIIFLQNFIKSTIKNFAVPIFFIISGYFFYDYGNNGLKAVCLRIRNKFYTLIYPYFLWNIFAIILPFISCFLLYPIDNNIDVIGELKESMLSFKDCIIGFIGKDFGYFPHNIPLWYIRDLVFLMLISPFICKILDKKSKIFLFFVIVLFVLHFSDTKGIHLQMGICFFSIGMWLKMNGIINFSISKKYLIGGIVIYCILSTSYFFYYNDYPKLFQIIKNCNICFCSIFLISVVYTIVQKYKLTGFVFLSKISFFVYLAHFPLIGIAKVYAFNIIRPHGDLECFVALILSYMTLISILSFTYLILSRTSKKIVKILIGR